MRWKENAACVGKGELFFSDDRPSIVRQARAICNTCPVHVDCLEYALEYGEFGVWAGTTGNQRAKLRRAQKKAAGQHKAAADPVTVTPYGEEQEYADSTGGTGGTW